MTALLKTTWVELKLFAREPLTVVFTFAIPLAFLFVLGGVFGNHPDPEVYRGFGFPGADDLGNMFQFKRDFNEYYCGARDLGFSHGLVPDMLSYDQWLAKHKGEIPIPA